MVRRFRIEVETEDREATEEELKSVSVAIKVALNHENGVVNWEMTDEFIEPIENEKGEAVIYGRRVFKTKEAT